MPEWLTWQQAGARFGLSPDALRMRARRLGWRTQPGNDGRTLVMVPDDADMQPRERAPEHSAERSPEQPGSFARLAELLAAADARAERADSRAERAEQRAEQAEQRADTAMARADAADTDRRAAKGRADQAEQAAAGERARADALRDRVDDLSAKLTDAQAELAAAQDQAEAGLRQLEAIQIALGEADADAAELRQTDTQRKGRGRWARLRVAWRGE